MARKKRTLKFKPPPREVREAFRIVFREELNEKLLGLANEKLLPLLNDTIVLEPSLEVEQAKRLLRSELEGRLFALYDLFSINPTLPGAGDKLALCLALEFVPGFDFLHLDRRGTPKRVIRDHAGLVEAIEKIRRESRQTVHQACLSLVKKPGAWKRKRVVDVEAAYYRTLQGLKNRKVFGDNIAQRLRLRGTADS